MTIFPPAYAERMIRKQMCVNFQRYERRPRVEAGKHYAICKRSRRPDRRSEPSIGRYLVKSVRLLHLYEISHDDAQAAGFVDKHELCRAFARWLEVDPAELDQASYWWRVEWEIIQVEDRIAA